MNISITPLSAARIAGEAGLAGGTITGGTYAVKYSSQVTIITKERDEAIEAKKPAEDKNVNLFGLYTQISGYWEQIKNNYNGQYKENMTQAIEQMLKIIDVKECEGVTDVETCNS